MFYFSADPLNSLPASRGCEELRAPWRKEAPGLILFHKPEGTACLRVALLFTALGCFAFRDLRKMRGMKTTFFFQPSGSVQ